MYYYAVVDIKDIVQYIDVLEEEVTYSDYVPIATEDYSLVGKWYDRYGKYGTVGAFIETPISVLAEHSTTQISYKDQDVWLDEKLDSYATNSSVQSALNNYSLSSHTHDVATTAEHGFLSKTDKSKLNSIEYNANNYAHPESHPASMITETDSLKIMTATERTKLSGIAENANNYVHPSTHSIGIIEESSTQKIMTADERTKLSGIEANANNYVHPAEHPASIITGLSDVATSGSYNDLSDKPTIPSSYTHPDTHPASMITGLSDVATSGSYEDLSDKPSSFTPAVHTHVQGDITGLSTALNSKANSSHTHAQSDISGLESALSGKAASSHTHTSASTSTAGFMSKDDKAKLDGISANANNYSHPASHPASMISGLSTVATSGSYADLSNKPSTFTPSAHTHAQSEISGLSTALSGKANSSHTHAQSEITGLESALSGKASSSHTHASASTSTAGFMSKDDKVKLNGIATNANNYSHPSTHPASMITGLSAVATSGSYADLSNKPSSFTPSSHTHTQSEISGLSSALNGKANSSHTHTAEDVGAISEDLSITSSTGSFKYSYATSDNKNVLNDIKNMPSGVFTVYSQAGVAGNPKTTESWRMLVHKTGNTVLWVKAFGSSGSEYSNYCADGVWQGWRCIYDVAPVPLWTGDMYMAASHTIIPSKALSECANGWLLLWSDYNPGESVQNVDFASTTIPKRTYNGGLWNNHQWLCTVPRYSNTEGEGFIIKTLHISNTQIVGNSLNNASPRNDVVLRAVYEF